ncbi:Cuticle protein 6, partial [Dufourea novaeangliae]
SQIPLFVALSLVSGAQLRLLPYAYLASPFPVYNQYQNTRTGEHAYSYAGGPSAKEEIKDADGVTRGSYSYIDANGILQSVFYVADENGFRVAATDLPTETNLDTTHVLLARSVKPEEQEKSSRRKRSLDVQDVKQSEIKVEGANVRTLLTPEATLIQELPLSTSHQSQVQIHRGEVATKDKPIDVLPLSSIIQAPTLLQSIPLLTPLPSYHENRIELHKQLGIEGAELKDAVKIDNEPLTLVQPSVAVPVASVLSKEAIVPATASVTTSISSHGISQVHPSSQVIQQPLAIPSLIAKQAVPVIQKETPVIAKEAVPVVPIVKEAIPKLATATVTTSISSHGVSQIHGDSKVKVEPTLLLRGSTVAQLHPVVNLPVY